MTSITANAATQSSLPSFDACLNAARERLRPKRFMHTLGVCHSAMALARMQGLDPGSAAVAALLHDIAKETEPAALKADLERRGRPLEEEDREFPAIWHAVAAAVWAEQDFGVLDAEILSAIRLHPTADADMGPLARTLFFADFTDPSRTWDGARELRNLARQDMDAAFRKALALKADDVKSHGKTIHPRAARALEAHAPLGPAPEHPEEEESHR